MALDSNRMAETKKVESVRMFVTSLLLVFFCGKDSLLGI